MLLFVAASGGYCEGVHFFAYPKKRNKEIPYNGNMLIGASNQQK
jgi:hypothetical protein